MKNDYTVLIETTEKSIRKLRELHLTILKKELLV